MLPTSRLLVYLGNIAMEVSVFVRMSCLHSIMLRCQWHNIFQMKTHAYKTRRRIEGLGIELKR